MTTQRILWLAVWAGSLVAVYQIARRDGTPEPRVMVASTEARPAAIGVTVPAHAGCALDERDVRRWVADAVRDQAPRSGTPDQPIDDRYEPQIDPDVAARAYDRGQELLREANARGTWTRSDAAQFRPLMRQLPADQRHALADALFDAIGSNRLRSELPAAPF